MSILNKVKVKISALLLGVLLAVCTVATPISAAPAYAEPVENPTENTLETPNLTEIVPNVPNTPETPEDETPDDETPEGEEGNDSGDSTCYSQVGPLGWLLCPATGFLAKGIDFLYGLIEELLVVQPVSTETSSPIYVVWAYIRNITNIVFIIFLLIIVYSQITGLGINNYGIKRALPKLIIGAILVNVSYIICALAVDVSNIIGASLHSFLAGVGEKALADGAEITMNVNFYDLFTTIAGTGVIAGLGIAITGGAFQLLTGIMIAVIGGFISVIVGLATISLRQAVIVVLVVISPLAFIAYLLPNTEKWYRKWLNTFSQMLIFYPMFSMLFGVSRLAGWMFIASANSALGVILGVVVQVLPLFLAASLLKMSGTVLGAVSSRLSALGGNVHGAARDYIESYRNAKRAEAIAKATQRPFNMFSGASWAAHKYTRNYRLADRQKLAEDTTAQLNAEQLAALKQGRRIIAYDRQTGEPIYTQRPISITRSGNISERDMRIAMESEAENRSVKLRAGAAIQRMNNKQSYLADHLKNSGVRTGKALHYSSKNGDYFIESSMANYEKMTVDVSDQSYLVDTVQKAMLRDGKTGELLNPAEYHRYIDANTGYAGLKINTADAAGKDRALTARYNLLGFMSQDIDALHAGNVKRMESYANNQVTKELLRTYEESRYRKYTDGIIACNNLLFFRGDHDKIGQAMSQYYNDGNILLGTADSNRLAMNLLAMKGAAPDLARFGKFLNMETWAFTDNKRGDVQVITMDQFRTGFVRIPETDSNGNLVYEDYKPDPINRPDLVAQRVKMTDKFLYKTKNGQPVMTDKLDENGNVVYDESGNPVQTPAYYRTKINIANSLKGTPMGNIDRTFGDSMFYHMKNMTPDLYPGETEAEREKMAEEALKDVYDAIMPQVIGAAPGFPSGSEQINVIARILTGLKPENYGGYEDTLESAIKEDKSTGERLKKAVKYGRRLFLSGLTANNVIYMKTDLWNAYTESFCREAEEAGEITLEEDFTRSETGPDGQKTFKTVHAAGTYNLNDIKYDEDTKKSIEKAWAYEQMRKPLKRQIDILARGSQNLEIMKLAVREGLQIDKKRNDILNHRKTLSNATDNNTGDSSDDSSTDWNSLYMKYSGVMSGVFSGSFEEWVSDIQNSHPEFMSIQGTGETWLDEAYQQAVLNGYIGTPEQWISDITNS